MWQAQSAPTQRLKKEETMEIEFSNRRERKVRTLNRPDTFKMGNVIYMVTGYCTAVDLKDGYLRNFNPDEIGELVDCTVFENGRNSE